MFNCQDSLVDPLFWCYRPDRTEKNPLNLTGMHCKSLTVILTPPPSPTLLCEAGFAEKEWKKVAK